MTPAERIAAVLPIDVLNTVFHEGTITMLDEDGAEVGVGVLTGIARDPRIGTATRALDALCPKGERVVLDRTRDTDRLIRQRRAEVTEIGVMADVGHPGAVEWVLSGVVWVDSPEGGEQ